MLRIWLKLVNFCIMWTSVFLTFKVPEMRRELHYRLANYQNNLSAQIDMSRFARGIYLIRLENETKIFENKIIRI